MKRKTSNFRDPIKSELERNLIQIRWVIITLLFSAALSCSQRDGKYNRNIERSIYHWKTTLNITPWELGLMDSLHIRTLYIKFFDVDYDDITHKPVPVGVLRTEESDVQRLRKNGSGSVRFGIIPTIFITDRCIHSMDTSQIDGLVNNIYQLTINTINSNSFGQIKEIQFDCDWTESTRDKYFLLLRKFHGLMHQTPLSATIRLHQVKFSARTGIPPVNRGLLMMYNMGNLKDPSAKNSILDVEELKKYITNLHGYPLSLDVALPLFRWTVLFRNNAFKGLFYDVTNEDLQGSSIHPVNDKRFEIIKDTVIKGYHLNAGDLVRVEESEYDDIISAVDAVKSLLPPNDLRVSLFHLDSLILRKYTSHDLENIYNSMR